MRMVTEMDTLSTMLNGPECKYGSCILKRLCCCHCKSFSIKQCVDYIETGKRNLRYQPYCTKHNAQLDSADIAPCVYFQWRSLTDICEPIIPMEV
jgi:hypothetical protein